jgi:dinuclear metal center YbgI/SA1388 family protein
MMTPRELIETIEHSAPLENAAPWDNSGVQLAGTRVEIKRLAVFLDPLPAHIDAALAWGADFMLCHHPLLLKPRLPDRVDGYHRVLTNALSCGSWLYAAHTTLDANRHGPVSWLARALEFKDEWTLEPIRREGSLLVVLRTVEQARILGALARCNAPGFEFGPMDDSRLWISCFQEEWAALRQDLLASLPADAVRVMRQEQPAREAGFGVIGVLERPLSWADFSLRLRKAVGSGTWAVAGTVPEWIRTVAYCPGSGGSLVRTARAADVFVTGDVKYHQAQESIELNLFTVDVGHFVLEERMMEIWAKELRTGLAGRVEVRFFPGTNPLRSIAIEQGEEEQS